MARVKPWSPDEARQQLKKRLSASKQYRQLIEQQWEANEIAVFNTGGPNSYPGVRFSFDSKAEFGMEGPDGSASDIGVNMAFKHWRFICAQMSANPPSVVARPTSSDYTDRRKADAADRLVRHAIRDKKLQELVDLASSKCILYGTSYLKTIWDPDSGDIVDIIDEDNGEFEMEGEIRVTTPSTRDIWLDPDAYIWDDVRFVFEALHMSLEEALFRFPDKEEELRQAMKKRANSIDSAYGSSARTQYDSQLENVEIYEYYEKGMGVNGMAGRHCYLLEDGTLLTPVEKNPFSFSVPHDRLRTESELGPEDLPKEGPPTAQLPYHILTDIDVPDQVYGKSFVEYEALIQDTVNRLDSAQLDNIQAHGTTRLVLPEGTEIAEGSITNSPWDIVKMTGSQPPHFMEVPTTMPDVTQFRDRLIAGGAEVAGVNEAMSGNTSRETSGFSMQYAVNQGNMIRRRLFNKYVLFVESVFKGYLNLVRKYWDEPRIIKVLGKEKAFEAVEIKGADISGGFDIVVEYGASLSLDPESRRNEIKNLYPLFKEAGVLPMKILQMLKLGELEGIHDRLEMAGERQYEIFQEMIATEVYIAPHEMEEHTGYLQMAYDFLVTTEFKYLEETPKELVRKHIKEREQMAAAQAAPAAGGPMVNPEGGPRAPAPDVPTPEAGPMAPMAAGGGAI